MHTTSDLCMQILSGVSLLQTKKNQVKMFDAHKVTGVHPNRINKIRRCRYGDWAIEGTLADVGGRHLQNNLNCWKSSRTSEKNELFIFDCFRLLDKPLMGMLCNLHLARPACILAFDNYGLNATFVVFKSTSTKFCYNEITISESTFWIILIKYLCFKHIIVDVIETLGPLMLLLDFI